MIVRTLAVTILAACAALTTSCGGAPPPPADRIVVTDADMVVYKSPYCGCCDLWIDHVQDHGYTVETVDVIAYDEMTRIKQRHGIPMDLGACHTTLVGDYTVEGHVPAAVIARLLEERPRIRGIAAAGMPIGSPGMEGPDPQPYPVIAIGLDGSRSVYEVVDPR